MKADLNRHLVCSRYFGKAAFFFSWGKRVEKTRISKMALSSDFQGLLARGSVVWGFTPKWGAEKSKGS